MKLRDFNLKFSRVLILCLIVTVLTAAVVYATVPQPFTINRGIYPGAPSFTVWEEDDIYFAKNSYGVITYSGTDEGAVINSALEAAYDSGGGQVYLKKGIYEADVILQPNVDLIGESLRNTIIQGTVSFHFIEGITGTSSPTHLKDLTIDAKAVGKNYGLNMGNNTAGAVMENLHIKGTVADIYYDGSDTYGETDYDADCFNNKFKNVYTFNGGTYGLYIRGYADKNLFENVWFGFQPNGVYMDADGRMNGCVFRDGGTSNIVGTGYLLYLTFATYNRFERFYLGDIESANSQYVKMQLESGGMPAYHNEFINCQFWGGGLAALNGQVVVGNNYYYTTFIDCTVFGKFNITSGAYYTSFMNIGGFNDTAGSAYSPTWINNGVGTICSGIGFDAYGITEVEPAGISILITDKMYGAPNQASYSIVSNDFCQVRFDLDPADILHFEIYHDDADNVTISWHVWYAP